MTEQQPDEVLEEYPDFELRRYPGHLVAEIVVGSAFGLAGSTAFPRIARYIGGHNRSSRKLAMTAPAVQEQAPHSRRYVVAQASAYVGQGRSAACFGEVGAVLGHGGRLDSEDGWPRSGVRDGRRVVTQDTVGYLQHSVAGVEDGVAMGDHNGCHAMFVCLMGEQTDDLLAALPLPARELVRTLVGAVGHPDLYQQAGGIARLARLGEGER